MGVMIEIRVLRTAQGGCHAVHEGDLRILRRIGDVQSDDPHKGIHAVQAVPGFSGGNALARIGELHEIHMVGKNILQLLFMPRQAAEQVMLRLIGALPRQDLLRQCAQTAALPSKIFQKQPSGQRSAP